MQPVQDMLHRIRWDPAFGDADFELGYYDRVADEVVRIPFAAVHFPADERFAFELFDASGEPCRVPFHRVRAIYRNGRCIWSRSPDRPGEMNEPA